MVQHNLEISDPVEVVKLVKKDAVLENLRSVSFKVGLDKGLKEKALHPSSWEGVYFREFDQEQRRRITFRKSGRPEEKKQDDNFSTPTGTSSI